MKRISLIIMVTIMLGSCGNKEEKNRMLSNITKMENQFAQSLNIQKLDPVLVRELTDEYVAFSNEFKSDSNSPRMLYRAAVMNLKYIPDQKKAVDLFIRLAERYPKYKETPMAIYTAAYIYNDLLKNTDKAKECYELLIKDYPDHYLTKEAKVLVQFVGKSDEQLLNAIIGKTIDSSKPSAESK